MKVIILAGGVGKRLLPATKYTLKPLLKTNNKISLLQRTLLRIKSIPRISEIVIVTNENYLTDVKKQCDLLLSNIVHSFIGEPFSRDTLPAITLATFYLHEKYKNNENILIIPSDHYIQNNNKFNESIISAFEVASLKEKITLLGITPIYPETDYGYIKNNNGDLHFVEKPNYKLALSLIKDNYLWNSGIICTNTDLLLSEIKKYCNNTFDQLIKSITLNKNKEIIISKDKFQDVESQSIDYSLLEKSKELSMIKCNINWSDVGSWNRFK